MAFEVGKIKENRAAWTAALRSGKYKQGAGGLRIGVGEDSRFCCLGVAADVGGCEWHGEKATYGGYCDDAIMTSGLNGSVLRLLGINEVDQSGLICMNDCDEATFSQIADCIDTIPLRGVE